MTNVTEGRGRPGPNSMQRGERLVLRGGLGGNARSLGLGLPRPCPPLLEAEVHLDPDEDAGERRNAPPDSLCQLPRDRRRAGVGDRPPKTEEERARDVMPRRRFSDPADKV